MALKSRVTTLMLALLSLLGYPVSPGYITGSCQAAVIIYKKLTILFSYASLKYKSNKQTHHAANQLVGHTFQTVISGYILYSQNHIWLI